VLEFAFQGRNAPGAVASFSATASDDCLLVSVVATPPSGSLFPIGITPVLVLATDACQNSAQCAFTVTVLGARGVKEHVLAELIALRRSVTAKETAEKLDDAIRHLAESLEPSRWVDQTHVAGKHGDKVFDEEKEAVQQLKELLKSKKNRIAGAVLQNFIDRIVKADRLLAVVSIQDAAADGVNPKKIAENLKEVEKGDQEAAEGEPDSAIEHYRSAWKHSASHDQRRG
jgi:hypothetical protein